MTRPIMSERRTSMLGALLTTIGPVSMAIYTPAMPALVHAFSTTDSVIKLSLSLYFAGFSCAMLVAGPASDAFGRRNATTMFLLVYLIGSLLAAFAPTVDWLLAGRLVQGIGASVGITVSRAIVRDQFLGPQAARILNMIGIILAIGPAASPTLGGVALAFYGWQAIFVLMVAFGVTSCLVVWFFMPETGSPDRALIRPARLITSYARLVGDMRVLLPALALGGSIGSLYAQSTMLPFILIDRVGLTPAQFGLGMLMQSGAFLVGSVALRMGGPRLAGWLGVTVGFAMVAVAAGLTVLSITFVQPSFLSVMGPVAVAAFGYAFIAPHITTSALAPHPDIAGSAAALVGFIQMGAGFLGGVAAALIGDPLVAFGIVIPCMQVASLVAYGLLRRILARSKKPPHKNAAA